MTNEDPRLRDFIQSDLTSIKSGDVAILGYPDDHGVSLSGGRMGAKEAPDTIRKYLYKMTPSLSFKLQNIFDAGNTIGHHEAQVRVKSYLSKNIHMVTLGGGHDYGFADFAAFCEVALARKKKPFIINFDAHLDVRPDINGPSSGTPFFRLLNQYSNIDFFEVGIQDWCNSKNHLKWAKGKGAKVLTFEEINTRSPQPLVKILQQKIFKHFDKKKHVLGVSIDIDAFNSGFCPGASQVFPVGLMPNDFLLAWEIIIKKYAPQIMGIYETNPTYDQDDRTSKFAAILTHRFCHR